MSGSSQELEPILLSVTKNISKLERTFLDLGRFLLRELIESSISVNDIVDHLTFTPLSFNKEIYNLIHDKMDKIENEKTLRSLFHFLNTVWNYLDYHLLEYIIIEFGSDSLNKDMKQYVSDFENFQQNTTLHHFVQCWPGRQKRPQDSVEVVAKLDLDPVNSTLKELDDLRKNIQSEFFQPRLKYIKIYIFLYQQSTEGSFIVTWIMPSQLADELISAVLQPESHIFFKENCVLSFCVGNQLLYEDEALTVKSK